VWLGSAVVILALAVSRFACCWANKGRRIWSERSIPGYALHCPPCLMAGHWRWACNMRRLTPLLPHWVGWWNLTPVSLLTCRQPPACRWPLGRKPVTLFTYIDVDRWTMFSHYSRVSAWCHQVPSSYLMTHDLIYAFFAAIVWTTFQSPVPGHNLLVWHAGLPFSRRYPKD